MLLLMPGDVSIPGFALGVKSRLDDFSLDFPVELYNQTFAGGLINQYWWKSSQDKVEQGFTTRRVSEKGPLKSICVGARPQRAAAAGSAGMQSGAKWDQRPSGHRNTMFLSACSCLLTCA